MPAAGAGKPGKRYIRRCTPHPPQAMTPSQDYKGNKQSLPGKPCSVCGRHMSWRKKWEKNWEQVKYCSEACRRARPAA